MKESAILKRILFACSRGCVRLWRNNIGQLQDREQNWIRYGIANPGGSDLIGFKTITVTEEMVGTKLAVFVAIEVKSASGTVTKHQQDFVDNVKSRGGIAGIARTVKEAKGVLTI